MKRLEPLVLLAMICLVFPPSWMGAGEKVGVVEPLSSTAVEVTEDIDTDRSWSMVESPYYINGSVTVLEGVTLEVLPGTRIVFGNGSSLEVLGSLLMGGETNETILEPFYSGPPGKWEGIIVENGSTVRMERVKLSGANVSVRVNGTCDVVVRNTTMTGDNSSLEVSGPSMVFLYNSSLDYDTINITGPGPEVRTFSYLSGIIVDHLGTPKGMMRFEVFDTDDIMKTSQIVNSTGEVSPVFLEGSSFVYGGRNRTRGTYKISLSDDPFTHYVNSTFLFNGTGPVFETFRFTWPPAFSETPEDIDLYEDVRTYVYTSVLDRNQVGHVDIIISSPRVDYNRTLERLEFLYTNETVLTENVTIELDDGYDNTTYSIVVNVTPRDDPLDFDFGSPFAYPVEDTPYNVELVLEDEDTPLDEIEVTTDDPQNITYDRSNTTLVLLYGDGTPGEFFVNVSATDGNTIVNQTLNIYFQPVYYSPEFVPPFPEFIMSEDEKLTVDMGPNIFDPDSDEIVSLSATSQDYDLFSVELDGYVLTVVPYPDSYGTGSLRLVLRDQRNFSAQLVLNVTIEPVDDAPTLARATVDEISKGTFRFNVTYTDIDGNMPSSVSVSVSEKVLNMTMIPEPDQGPKEGILYTASWSPPPGRHPVDFFCVQGEFEIGLEWGNITVEEIEVAHVLEGYSGSLEMRIWTLGEGGPLNLTQDAKREGAPPGSTPLGCDISVYMGGLSATRVFLRLWVADFRTDILESTVEVWFKENENWSQAGVGAYEISTGTFSVWLDPSVLNFTISAFADLDPDHDSDEDGWPNSVDAFPEDATEWEDSDQDGIGDNADEDDDNDGFIDEVERAANTSTRNPDSYPKDTDGDGELDYIDDDDDGDGMDDQWEIKYGLDPLDPSDADEDPDGDGISNLEEYRQGSHPFDDERVIEDDGDEFPVYIVISAGVILALLAGLGLFILFSSRSDEEEAEVKEAIQGDEWDIQGELDPEDAVDCPECGEIFPIWEDECPFCGEPSPYSDEEA